MIAKTKNLNNNQKFPKLNARYKAEQKNILSNIKH